VGGQVQMQPEPGTAGVLLERCGAAPGRIGHGLDGADHGRAGDDAVWALMEELAHNPRPGTR
jgi:hypothetical protein